MHPLGPPAPEGGNGSSSTIFRGDGLKLIGHAATRLTGEGIVSAAIRNRRFRADYRSNLEPRPYCLGVPGAVQYRTVAMVAANGGKQVSRKMPSKYERHLFFAFGSSWSITKKQRRRGLPEVWVKGQ
jgi:hypothetical protein